MKRISVISALLFSGDYAKAEESQYKMRIHKNFVKKIIDTNFNVIL
jgi:hypothetical protein